MSRTIERSPNRAPLLDTMFQELPYTEFGQLKRYLVLSPTVDNHRISKSVAENIEELLKRKKLSQKVLGEVSGIDHSGLSRLLAGARQPKLNTLSALFKTKYFNDDLVYGIIMDSVPTHLRQASQRHVFSDEAPILTGTLHQQLKGYRMARELSQRELVETAIVDHSTISRIETGNSSPMFSSFANIVYVLGTNRRQTVHLARS